MLTHAVHIVGLAAFDFHLDRAVRDLKAVLDVVNHYNWRYKRHPADKKEGPHAAQQQWRGLDKTDGWQDKYFRGNFLASRDRFFFPSSGGG